MRLLALLIGTLLVAACSPTAPPSTPSPVSSGTASTPRPSPRPSVEAISHPTLPAQPAWPGDPVLQRVDGTRVPPAMRGGCGAVFYRDEGVASDQCGPTGFDPAIAVEAAVVGRDEVLVLDAPERWRLGTDPALAQRWFVRVVATLEVAGLEEVQGTLPAGVGRTIAAGTGSAATLRIAAPTTSGDYLLQFEGGVSRDGWSFLAGTWYWHIRVS